MNDLIQKLLQPISPDQPCGPDLSNDGRFGELETILKGKPEIDFGPIVKPAEPPDWRQLQQKSGDFLRESKNLRVAMMYCCSLLRTGGLPGFRDGLQLLRGLIEQFWPSVYPLLDPEDNNDPTYRLNILSGLTAPRGSVTGFLAIMDNLYAAPLCQPKGAAPVTFEMLQSAKLRHAGTEGAPAEGPTLPNLTGVMRAAGEQLGLHHHALQESLEAVRGMDQFLANTLTAHKSMSFEELEKTLQEMLSAIQPYLSGQGEVKAQTSEAGATENTGDGTSGIIVSGSIRSREDVVNAIESICRYYDQVEPGSPVPFLLRRAQKLAIMNFVQAVQELNLISGLDALRPSMGSAVDGATSAPQPPAS